MIDLVLRIQTIGREQPVWLVEAGAARERIPPLTDEDLRAAAAAATPAGQPSVLPALAATWSGLLDHLGSNTKWQPNARTLELVGKLLHDHLIRGKIAEHVARFEAKARARMLPLRYVVHVFEGEEDGLLPRLPFELLHHGSFWFRRANSVGVRLPPDSEPCDVRLGRGAAVLIAAAHADGREPSAAQLAEHVTAIQQLVERAGFTARALPDCTPAALAAALEEGYDVVYLVCHGEEDLDLHGRLALRDGAVTGRQLGEWLEAAGRRTQAVLLCACSSAVPGRRQGTMGMAQHLAATGRRASAALGFRAPVGVAWALAFTTEVFTQLAAGRSLELAVAAARRKQPEDDSQWSLPLMFAHERDPFAPEPAAAVHDPDARSKSGPPWLESPLTTKGVDERDVFEPLALDDAVARLAALTRDGEPFPPEEIAAARALALVLADMPLAIEVAGGLIRRGASLEEARLAALSGTGGAADASVFGRVSRVMERSLADLDPGDAAAWTLIAALDAAGVTEAHVAAGLEEPAGRAARRLFRLRQASLVRFEPATARYTMHPLARQVARARAEASGTWDQALARVARASGGRAG